MASVVTAAVAAAAPQPTYDLAKWKYAELRDTINTSTGKHTSSVCEPVKEKWAVTDHFLSDQKLLGNEQWRAVDSIKH